MTGSEVAKLMRFAFDMWGRRRLSADEIVQALAFQRRWLAPSMARRVVAAAAGSGILEAAGANEYAPGFETEGVRLDLSYVPSIPQLETELASAPARSSTEPVGLFRRIVRRVASSTGQTDAEVVAGVNKQQAAFSGLVTAEVAALVYARLLEVDVQGFMDEAWATLRSIRT